MPSTNSLAALMVGLASLQTAVAAPKPETRAVPEVKPGEGLPSLESLGLTSEHLYSLPKPEGVNPYAKDGEVSALYDGNCGPDNAYVPVDDAIACYHYLNSLGAQACSVPENLNAQILCQAGEATITGLGTAQTSECGDVAYAVLWTIDHCTHPEQDTAGKQAAFDNGNFVIWTHRFPA